MSFGVSDLARVPLNQVHSEKQRTDRTDAKKDTERQEHLHVSFTLVRHQADADD